MERERPPFLITYGAGVLEAFRDGPWTHGWLGSLLLGTHLEYFQLRKRFRCSTVNKIKLIFSFEAGATSPLSQVVILSLPPFQGAPWQRGAGVPSSAPPVRDPAVGRLLLPRRGLLLGGQDAQGRTCKLLLLWMWVLSPCGALLEQTRVPQKTRNSAWLCLVCVCCLT